MSLPLDAAADGAVDGAMDASADAATDAAADGAADGAAVAPEEQAPRASAAIAPIAAMRDTDLSVRNSFLQCFREGTLRRTAGSAR
jgi:hypothetical protein